MIVGLLFLGTIMFLVKLRRSPGWPFGIALLAMAAVGLYVVVAQRFNRTVITLADGRLTTRHGPLPWWGNHTLDRSDIEQLYCEHYRVEHRGHVEEGFRVMAIVIGRAKPLIFLDRLAQAGEALDLEREIEEALGVADKPVPGEIASAHVPRNRLTR